MSGLRAALDEGRTGAERAARLGAPYGSDGSGAESGNERRPAEADTFPLLTGDELLSMPDPEWLVEDLIPELGLSVLFGAPGSFKSFLALDWALSVAAGVPWLGHEVKPRWVVYIAAEGRGGLKLRYQAWLAAHGVRSVERVRFLPEAVNLLEREQVERARRTLATLPERCGLIVLDTMARTMVGGDENATRDVGRFINAVDDLADARLVVHHSGHAEAERERGSSALRAAADLSAQVTRDDGSRRVTLACKKLKDGPEWPAVDLRVEDSAGSLVLSRVVETAEVRDDLKDRVLAYVTEYGPVSKRQVRAAVEGRDSRIDEALRDLQAASRIERAAKGYVPWPGPPATVGHASSAASEVGPWPAGGRDPEGPPPGPRPRAVAAVPVAHTEGHAENGPAAAPSPNGERPLAPPPEERAPSAAFAADLDAEEPRPPGPPPCGYERHRGRDWRLAEGGPVTCGVYHPPVPGLRVVRVGEPDAEGLPGEGAA